MRNGTKRGLPMTSMNPDGAPPVTIRAPTAHRSRHGRPPARRRALMCSKRQPPTPCAEPRADVRAAQSNASSDTTES